MGFVVSFLPATQLLFTAHFTAIRLFFLCAAVEKAPKKRCLCHKATGSNYADVFVEYECRKFSLKHPITHPETL